MNQQASVSELRGAEGLNVPVLLFLRAPRIDFCNDRAGRPAHAPPAIHRSNTNNYTIITSPAAPASASGSAAQLALNLWHHVFSALPQRVKTTHTDMFSSHRETHTQALFYITDLYNSSSLLVSLSLSQLIGRTAASCAGCVRGHAHHVSPQHLQTSSVSSHLRSLTWTWDKYASLNSTRLNSTRLNPFTCPRYHKQILCNTHTEHRLMKNMEIVEEVEVTKSM